MRTGAEQEVVEQASLTLLRVEQALRDERRRVRAALEQVQAGAALPEARQAGAGADEALSPLLRALRDTARTLGDDASEQLFRSRATDHR